MERQVPQKDEVYELVPAPDLPGWPGYRNRDHRSGLDPIDTYREEAFMTGLFLRSLFTLKLKTRDPVYLFLMAVFGFSSLALALPFADDAINSTIHLPWPDVLWVWLILAQVLVPPLVLGIFLLANLFANLKARKTSPQEPTQRKPKSSKRPVKVPIKRRKD